jgi:hypothetical protein
MTLRTRQIVIGIAVAAITIVATLIALALLEGAGRAQPLHAPIECVPDEAMKTKIRDIVLDSLDGSLREHVERMYHVWMKDDGSPARDRAGNGTRIGIRAYIRARTDVMKWNPPICPEGGKP